MNIYEWISAGISRIVAGLLIALLSFGVEIISIKVRIAQSKQTLDDILNNDKMGVRFSFIPFTAISLYDIIKGLPLWTPLVLTMWVIGMYAGLRWTENKRKS